MKGLDIVESGNTEIISSEDNVITGYNGSEKLANAVADNFGTILSIAEGIVDIRKMRAQSDIMIAEMQEQRKQLLAETEAYVSRKEIDTKSTIDKMEIIREMMKDFYQFAPEHLSGSDFKSIISELVEQMGKVENG